MIKVKNSDGREIDFDAAALLMDDDLREQVYFEWTEDEQAFFDRYCILHRLHFDEDFVPDTNGAW